VESPRNGRVSGTQSYPALLWILPPGIEDTIAAFAMPWQRQSTITRVLAGDFAWSLPDDHRPAIGTLSTGQFMASSQLVAGDRIVVLLENGLFSLSRTLAQVAVLGYQEATDSGRLSEPTVQSISDVIASYLTLGDVMGLLVRQHHRRCVRMSLPLKTPFRSSCSHTNTRTS
jgi:hypothetical protein